MIQPEPSADTAPDHDLNDPQTDLMTALRDGTRARHDAVEARPIFKAPFEPGFAKTDYRTLLCVLTRAYRGVERQIASLSQDDLFQALKDSPSYWTLIETDLMTLGGPVVTSDAAASPGDLKAPETPAGALGARYVLEGSMMGGMHLRKVLRRTFGEDFVAGLAFHGQHLAKTDIKDLRARLSTALAQVPTERRAEAMDGAHWAFDCFDAAHGA